MALQFVIGHSGSGKSTALYEYIIHESLQHPKTNYLILTPDQFTLDTQKMMIGMHPRHGTLNIDILSFHRLAYKVFEEVSREPGVILEDLGKSMVLQKILGKRKKDLTIFGGNRDKMGFIDELKSLLSEFYQYGITQESLRTQLKKEKEGSLLHKKLTELLIVMEEFEAFMGEDYIVAEQLLTVLGKRAEEAKSLKGSVIVLDGFTGFTPVQYDLLEKLLPLCSMMYVTVTIDKEQLSFGQILDYELFSVSKETIARFRKMAHDTQVSILPDWIIEGNKGRFARNPEMDFLERNIFRPRQSVYEKKTESIALYQLADPEEEALFAAKTISHLVREEGYRYRDIAVISGDPGRYSMRLSRIFEEYEIPCFIDDTKGMRSHPLVECIRGIFALFEFDFSYESVCHYGKNGMTNLKKEDADALDNFLLATGLRGFGALSGEFKKKPRQMSEKLFRQAETARKELMGEIGDLSFTFRKRKAKVRNYIEALYQYMVKMQYEERLLQEAHRFEEQGEFVFASAYKQVYPLIIALFDKIVAILGEEELELVELRKIMDAGLDEMELGVIPPSADQIVVGDMERTRLGNIKVLIFLGINEGIIPKPTVGGGILSDADRENLSEKDFQLAPGARKSTGMEQFYLYLGLTKPSKKLYLTLAKVDQEGKSIRPSYLVGRMTMLFPKLAIFDRMDEKREYFTMKSSLPYVREGLEKWFMGESSKEDEDFLHWLFQTEEGKEWIFDALKGRFYTNGESALSLETAKAIYGLSMEASVTRLEHYAGCAFAHFLRYGMMLAERQKYQLRSADLGQILHKCLELVIKETKGRGQGLRFIGDEARDNLAIQCLRRAVEEYDSAIFHSSARNEAAIDRMERLVKRTVWALQEQLKKSDFEPKEFEWKFQSRKDLEAVKLNLEHGASMELRGVIDRIDYFEDEENLYMKITDYKSGMQTFQLSDIYNGLTLQLVVYLNAAMEKERQDQGKNVVPAGIFYFHIQDPLVELKDGESPEDTMLSQFDLSGLVLGEKDVVEHLDFGEVKSIPVAYKKDGNFTAASNVASREQFAQLGNYVKRQMRHYGNEIMNGNISIEPYKEEKRTACDYCEYRGVCGFDPAFSGNRYKKLKKQNKHEIWNQLEERG